MVMGGRSMSINKSNILNINLADAGHGKIKWAKQFMPAIAESKEVLKKSGTLAGKKVGVNLVFEPKTAVMASSIAETGAEVFVIGHPGSTRDDVAAALVTMGVTVYANSTADEKHQIELINQFIDNEVELLIDDSAGLTRLIHTVRRDALGSLEAVAEETTSGVRPLRVMEQEGTLEVPCLAVNDARSKQLFDNVYGTGQSGVMAIIDVTNINLQGKIAVVVGYGYVGKGTARFLHELGARVVVSEIDPIRALQAIHDGYNVAKLETMCPIADIFITATGIGYSITGDHMRLMKDGAILSVNGAGPPEIDLGGKNPVERGDMARADVRSIPIGNDREVFLISDGGCSNCDAGEGNPIEIMDLSLALQMRAIDYLAANAKSMENKVYLVPKEIDDAVAKSALNALGAEIDVPSPKQIEHANSWKSDSFMERIEGFFKLGDSD
jgi:adenosylhomocysteinase